MKLPRESTLISNHIKTTEVPEGKGHSELVESTVVDWIKCLEEESPDNREGETMESPCVMCKNPTADDDKAMACDVCDKWEHVGCLRHRVKLSTELHVCEALKECRSRAILYVCTQCRAKGSIIKRLHEYEVDSAHVQEQWLASVQCTDELSERIRELREKKQGLLVKQAALEKEVQSLMK